MNRVLNFISFAAFGLLVAGALMVAGGGSAPRLDGPVDGGAVTPGALDLRSLLAGIAAGLLMATMGRISWFDLPQRMIAWLQRNERKFLRLGMAGLCLGVLLFY
jgi:hypothetical protein